MAVSFFPEYGGLYNNYKVVDIPRVDINTVKKQDEEKKLSEMGAMELPKVNEVVPATEPEQPDLRSKTADLENISLTFNTGDDYSFLGSDFNIEDLDMQKAISDMQKDGIIQDYNYFVGSTDLVNNGFENEDGRVFLKY